MIAQPETTQQLPHSEESERAVLAACLIDAALHLPSTSARLTSDDFFLERHRRIYESMLYLQDERQQIDLRTLQARLEQQDELSQAGGVAYLATLEVDLPSLSNVESYVEIIKERALRRRLMEACRVTFTYCLDGGLTAQEALSEAEKEIFELGEQAVKKGFSQLGNVFATTVTKLENHENFKGISSGFVDYDALSHGLHGGHLLILAGRPGMGKTSLALNIATHVAMREGKSVGVFSLEMGEEELAMRILCSEADVPFGRLREGQISEREWARIHQTVQQHKDSTLYIDDTASATMLEVASKARRLKMEKGLDLLVIDYLQLMTAGGRYENRNLEVGAMSRGFKQLAKELNIPVLCLSQLSRQTERRGTNHRPQLSDLRESGSIEQDADMVMFVYRDEIYNPDDPTNHGMAELIISKHRSGATGTIELAFIGDTTSFRNLEKYGQPPGDMRVDRNPPREDFGPEPGDYSQQGFGQQASGPGESGEAEPGEAAEDDQGNLEI